MNHHAPTLTTVSQRTIVAIIGLIIAGCNDTPTQKDKRLEEFARHSMAQQSRQNEVVANQATAVVQSSHEIANSANNLVQQDARARHEMIQAYRDLAGDLNRQQSAMDEARNEIEKDRRELARLRHRDPILVASIQSFGLLLASMLPLGMAAFVIYQMNHQEPEHAAVAELLIRDLGSDKPAIWPCIQQQMTQPREIGHTGYGRDDLDTDDDPHHYE